MHEWIRFSQASPFLFSSSSSTKSCIESKCWRHVIIINLFLLSPNVFGRGWIEFLISLPTWCHVQSTEIKYYVNLFFDWFAYLVKLIQITLEVIRFRFGFGWFSIIHWLVSTIFNLIEIAEINLSSTNRTLYGWNNNGCFNFWSISLSLVRSLTGTLSTCMRRCIMHVFVNGY